MESLPRPEDVDQDEVDEAVRRVRSRTEAALARSGLVGFEVRVRIEVREGRLWVVGEVQPKATGGGS
jgi:hypothetical protein